jgi:hypothetical protein
MKSFYRLIIAVLLLISIQSCTNDGASAPILLLATQSNFGTYCAEMLKAEGFNEFVTDSLNSDRINLTFLRQFDYVLLAEEETNPKAAKLLEKYINSGGILIAFKPDTMISGLFGIKSADKEICEGYIAVNPEGDYNTGITAKNMQFHGTADVYRLNGAMPLAYIFADNNSEEKYPGVVINKYGKGHAIAFTYNLPKSIVYTRQGNPLHAGMEMDGIPGLRGMDLFTNGWVDTSLNTINQADQQMALLTNCIQELNTYTKPLPRFWYFPDSLKCIAVLDNDGEDNCQADFEPQFVDVDAKGAKMTIYLKDIEKVSKKWVDKWTSKGFEVAIHPDDTQNAANPTWNNMDSAITRKISDFKNLLGMTVRTNVNHWFVWCGTDENGNQDFGAQAKLEEKHGIEMDANYAIYDINSNQPANYLGTPGYNQGNYTGSGLGMKYADVNGKTVNVYQRFNAVYDQQYNEGSTKEGFFQCFKGLVDRSLYDDIYSVVSIKSHNNEYYFSKEPLMKMLDYANEKGVPVWTAFNLLDFLKMKDEASFSNISWRKNVLSFNLNSSLKHSAGLTFMVPAMFSGKKIGSVIKDNKETAFGIQKVKGKDYAFVTVNGGSNYGINVSYR